MSLAIFPGSFDPITYGHFDIISRTSKLFDTVMVVIANNHNKDALLSMPQRACIINLLLKNFPNLQVTCLANDLLLADFCKNNFVDVIVRGLRSGQDLAYEMPIAQINKDLAGVETLFLCTPGRFLHISSSLVREVFRLGGDISSLVPPVVENFLCEQ